MLTFSAAFTPGASGNDPWAAPDSYYTEDTTAPGMVSKQEADNNMATKTASEQAMTDRMVGPSDGGTVPKGSTPADITPVVDGPLTTGVLQEPLPLPTGWGSLYKIENTWQDVINGQRTAAYAGLAYDASISAQLDTTSQPAQGVLIVMTFPDPDTSTTSGTEVEHKTPTRTGSLHLTSANGACLNLISTTGAAYQFSIGARTWSCP
jgi:hypothetical protein